MKTKGFSIIEVLVALGVMTALGLAVGLFARNTLTLNSSSQAGITAIMESRKVLSVMISELRSATPSALGSYPVEQVSTSSIAFFTDVNGDEVADRVRYSLNSSGAIERRVVLAAGEPPAYNLGSESITVLVTGIVNSSSTPIFEYFDGNYTGTSSPLSYPINISDIRLVKVNLLIDKDPNREPPVLNISSQATFRNLKDNI